ncbi:MAG: hypothetical protein KatS3mg108_3417 [Isosphaeraceae bacterium]|jgi:sugar phosphate isomerase/epimerase|nr:MAG: hypothetical protein KatS3mg108_3417 [Isosphaeraceae bacterium]
MSGLPTTRRQWLQGALAVAPSGWLIHAASSAAGPRPEDPFRLGLQSYSLRAFSFREALAKTAALGLSYWESFSAHIPPDPARAAEHRRIAQDAGITVNGFGVVAFTADHDANRRLFDFGKALGIAYFSADPSRDAFDSLDKLVEEYDIPVGIHNHGPGHQYASIASIRDAIRDHDRRIGCCIDTGHFLRAQEDPVEAAKTFEGRIYGVHLKDVKDGKVFVVLGQGDLDTRSLLAELARQKYGFCLALEYEENPEDPMADLEACLTAYRQALPAQ